jgi:hypothetical protein
MFEKIKQDLFTIHGLVTTIMHVCFVVGIVTCWIAVQTQVLGNDPLAVIQKQQPSSAKR